MPQLFGPGTSGDGLLNNFGATTAPGVGDDSLDGYDVGSRWINVNADKLYTCFDASSGAAVWILIDSVLNNYGASVDPVVGDDANDGYEVGSQWINTTLDSNFVCVDSTVGAAVWASATGDVSGPASSANNAVALFDGTGGKLLKDASAFKFQSGVITLSGVAAALDIRERTTGPSVATGQGEYWVKDDVPTQPRFTDDAGTAWRLVLGPTGATTSNALARFDAVGNISVPSGLTFSSGGLKLGNATASLEMDERAGPVTVGAGEGTLWVKDDVPTRPKFTNDLGAEAYIDGDVKGPGSATDNAVARYDGTTGKLLQNAQYTRIEDDGEITILSGATQPDVKIVERAAAPAGTADYGKFYVRNSTPNRPWFASDDGQDQRLGMHAIHWTGLLDPSTSKYWRSWSSAGPYNDTTLSTAWSASSSTAPTTGIYYLFPPAAILPGDSKIERVLGWYQASSGTSAQYQFELTSLSFEDGDTTAGALDVHCDGSTNGISPAATPPRAT